MKVAHTVRRGNGRVNVLRYPTLTLLIFGLNKRMHFTLSSGMCAPVKIKIVK